MMESFHNKHFGAQGEDLACSFLKKQGYRIIEQNFRTRNGEVDIIAIDESQKPHTLVFVEVKTRISNRFGSPFESIHYYKMKALMRTAQFYQSTHRNLPQLLRIDAIAVILFPDGTVSSIEHLKNVSS